MSKTNGESNSGNNPSSIGITFPQPVLQNSLLGDDLPEAAKDEINVNPVSRHNLQTDHGARQPGVNGGDSNQDNVGLAKKVVQDRRYDSGGSGVGHTLQKARIAKGLSAADIARQMRLSLQQIEAIENDDFAKLPGRTFLRGFIRNYAHLVQLDSKPLLQLLPESTPVVPTYERTPFKNSQVSFSSNRKNPRGHPIVITVVLLIIMAGIYFAIEDTDWNRESEAESASVQMDGKTANGPASDGTTAVQVQLSLPIVVNKESQPQLNTNNTLDDQLAATVPEKKLDVVPEKAVVAEAKPDSQKSESATAFSGDLGRLHFTFTKPSWVKVVDGTGRSLFEQLMKGGSEQTVSGKPPLAIVIGDASGVNLTYNDKEIDISSHRRQDGTARFKLE